MVERRHVVERRVQRLVDLRSRVLDRFLKRGFVRTPRAHSRDGSTRCAAPRHGAECSHTLQHTAQLYTALYNYARTYITTLHCPIIPSHDATLPIHANGTHLQLAVEPVAHDQVVAHAHAVRLHGVAHAVVVVADVAVIVVRHL